MYGMDQEGFRTTDVLQRNVGLVSRLPHSHLHTRYFYTSEKSAHTHESSQVSSDPRVVLTDERVKPGSDGRRDETIARTAEGVSGVIHDSLCLRQQLLGEKGKREKQRREMGRNEIKEKEQEGKTRRRDDGHHTRLLSTVVPTTQRDEGLFNMRNGDLTTLPSPRPRTDAHVELRNLGPTPGEGRGLELYSLLLPSWINKLFRIPSFSLATDPEGSYRTAHTTTNSHATHTCTCPAWPSLSLHDHLGS